MLTKEQKLAYIAEAQAGIQKQNGPSMDGPSCMYNHDNGSHCAIGWLFYNRGIPVHEDWEGETADAVFPGMLRLYPDNAWLNSIEGISDENRSLDIQFFSLLQQAHDKAGRALHRHPSFSFMELFQDNILELKEKVEREVPQQNGSAEAEGSA